MKWNFSLVKYFVRVGCVIRYLPRRCRVSVGGIGWTGMPRCPSEHDTRYHRPMRPPRCRKSCAKKSGHRICDRNSSLEAFGFGSIWLLLSSLLLTRFALVLELTIRCCTTDGDAVLEVVEVLLLLHWWLVGATVGSAMSGAIVLSVRWEGTPIGW